MKGIEKLALFFIVIILISIAAYNYVLNQKTLNFLYEHNKMCEAITTNLKEQVNENSTCIDYYCYYAPYAPPEGTLQNKTTTLCICDCRLSNLSVITIQILSTVPKSYTLSSLSSNK